MPEFKRREEEEGEAPLTDKPMTVIAWTKSPLGAILRMDPKVPHDIAKLKAKSQLKQFLANESEALKDDNIVFEILEPGENSNLDQKQPPRLVSAIDFQGQIIELIRNKVFIVAVDSYAVQPEQAYYIMEQLSEAGIKAGVMLASRSDAPVMWLDEHPLELGDGSQADKRTNARNALVEAQNEMQTAARKFISANAEALEQLDLQQPPEQAEAFSNLFVAIEQAYDAAEAPLNADQIAEQNGLK